MKTVQKFITDFLNKQDASIKIQFTKINNEGDRVLFQAIKDYTKEAIKEDRLNVVQCAKVHFDEGTNLENVYIDEDSIINAPQIELL